MGLYVVLVGITAFLFQQVPSGFVPGQDKQYLVGFARLPDGATLDRSEEVIRKMSDIALTQPGVESSVAFPGLSISGFTNSSNAGIVFSTLKPFDERKGPALSGNAIAADLNNKTDLARIETTLRTNTRITLLVNDAGVGATAPLLDSDVEKMDEMICLNVSALTRLTDAAATGFVARGGGTIINIASAIAISPETLKAISPETLNGVYGGSKAFVLAFSQSLDHELAGKGVRVQAVLPGATATQFWDIAGLPDLPSKIGTSADDPADAALASLDERDRSDSASNGEFP